MKFLKVGLDSRNSVTSGCHWHHFHLPHKQHMLHVGGVWHVVYSCGWGAVRNGPSGEHIGVIYALWTSRCQLYVSYLSTIYLIFFSRISVGFSEVRTDGSVKVWRIFFRCRIVWPPGYQWWQKVRLGSSCLLGGRNLALRSPAVCLGRLWQSGNGDHLQRLWLALL